MSQFDNIASEFQDSVIRKILFHNYLCELLLNCISSIYKLFYYFFSYFLFCFSSIGIVSELLRFIAQNDLNPTSNNSKKKLNTMKKLSIVITLIALFSIASLTVNAQVTATATASANIVTPINLTNAGDMNFGNVAVSSTGGTVILAPASTRTATGGVTLPFVPGTVTAAQFAVTGTPSYTYSITLPSTATTVTSGANTMTVDAFTSIPAATGTLDAAGTQTIDVGATLNVTANQASGIYLSGTPFDVTVNYN